MKEKKPHLVFIPYPAQGHINPMMQLAKLLHSRGFFITFVNTDFAHKRLSESRGPDSLDCLDGFRFETISDDKPLSAGEVIQDAQAFCKSIQENCVEPLRGLLRKFHGTSDGPGVTCIIWDRYMTFTLQIAQELEIPEVTFCPTAACTFMAIVHYSELIRRGVAPLKDESYMSNGYLDTTIDWIPGMKEIRLRDLPSFIRTTDPDDFFLNYAVNAAKIALKASAIIFNTFDDLEHEVLHAIQSMFFPRMYTIGPLLLQSRLLPDNELKSVKSSMWKEEENCLKWLDSHEASSIIYVNFGSITVITEQQLMEFGWGIANSNHPFLWVIRPDLVTGGHKNLPQDLMDEIEGRGMISIPIAAMLAMSGE
ncbi:hypothetical protein AAC387_Pa08g0778 [Persea americana]